MKLTKSTHPTKLTKHILHIILSARPLKLEPVWIRGIIHYFFPFFMQLAPFCANCQQGSSSTCPPIPHHRAQYFEEYCVCTPIPILSIRYFEEGCDVTTYIAATIGFELRLIKDLIYSRLENLRVGPLPEVSTMAWLRTHVNFDSTAYPLLS